MAPPARWTNILREKLAISMKENPDSISYALASHANGVCAVRFVVHRDFVNSRRPGEDPTWSSNPTHDDEGRPLINDNMMVTTDVRGPKAAQISANSPVSLAWWQLPTKTQFRITADAYIFPPPNHPLHSQFPAERLAPCADFSWEAERLRIWRKMSADLRASFLRPVPGTKLEVDPHQWPETLPTDLEAKTDEEKRLVQQALANFSLIVLEPNHVDLCELGVVPNKRTIFTLENGTWREESVVP